MKTIKGIIFFALFTLSASGFAYTITKDDNGLIHGTCATGGTFIGTYSRELKTANMCHNKRGCFHANSKSEAIRKACDE